MLTNNHRRLVAIGILVAAISCMDCCLICPGSGKLDKVAMADLQLENRITREELNKLMSRPGVIDRQESERSYDEAIARRAADYLASTKDKDEPGTILNKYSVNDLLSLAKIYTRDYNEAELERRQGVCNDLKPASEHEAEISRGRLFGRHELDFQDIWSPDDALANQKVYLYKYCKRTLDFFVSGYRHHLLREIDGKLSNTDKEILDRFERDFDMHQRLLGNALPKKDRVHEFISGHNEKKVTKIRKSCNKLIALMRDRPVALPNLSNLGDQFNLCQHL